MCLCAPCTWTLHSTIHSLRVRIQSNLHPSHKTCIHIYAVPITSLVADTAGFADQTGGLGAPNSTLNIPLAPLTSWQGGYRAALQRGIDAACEYGAQAVVVSLGLDTYAEDPVAAPGAGLRLRQADYRDMGNMLAKMPGTIMEYFILVLVNWRYFACSDSRQ